MDSLLIAARAVHFAATISVAGVFAFLCFVIRAEAPVPLARRLRWLAVASLALAALSGAAWLVLLSARISGEGFTAALTRGAAATVLLHTRFGTVWSLRAGLAAALAVLLALPARWRGKGWRWVGLALGAALLGLLGWAGHGGATPGRPGELHLAGDIVHLLAAGAWVGALVPLALALAETGEAEPGGGAAGTGQIRALVWRFSVLAAVSVGFLLAGGIVNTWFLAGTVPALIGTLYGRLLLAKITLFVAMVAFGSVNLLRMSPRLAPAAARDAGPLRAALGHLRRNALVEAVLAALVIGLVATLGILPPGLHSEPGWPLPFRIELALLSPPAVAVLALAAALAATFAVAAAASAAAGHYRRAAIAGSGLALCALVAALVLRPAAQPAYPTSFYAPAEPYAAASVAHGARLYAENCALCHGRDGKGDGPAAASLPRRPADLTAPHLFAHTPGDLFWWVSHGKGGVMPGFAPVMNPADRWDVINFIRARAAGILSRTLGAQVTRAIAPRVPDFAFETGHTQHTLDRLLSHGPVLVVLFTGPPPPARLAQLQALRARFATAGPALLILDLDPGGAAPEAAGMARVEPRAAAILPLFRSPADGGETDLLLDRAGASAGGPVAASALTVATEQIRELPPAAESHAGHVH
jgi:putative copper export protein/mono/diheme cytochrome c family protein